MKSILSFCFILISFVSFGQSDDLFRDPERAKEFFDGRKYEVPGYGTLTLTLNKAQTNREADKRKEMKADDEEVELVFDVTVKRLNAKKKDKGDYKVNILIYLTEKDDPDTDPNRGMYVDFSLMRQIIFPIKGFPSLYTIFADGDLYFWKLTYKKYSLADFKRIKLQTVDSSSAQDIEKVYTKCEYVRCPPSTK